MLAPEQSSIQTLGLIEEGPLLEATQLSAGLDYYKPTMSQFAHELEPQTEVTFTFHNRGDQRLLDYVAIDALQDRFAHFQEVGFSQDEIEYLGSLHNSDNQPVFQKSYLDYLVSGNLPPVNVFYDPDIDDIGIETSGTWDFVTFWETVVMAEVNEAYFEGYLRAHDINPMDVYNEGDARLSEKIALLHDNPQIKFADFGTRRHFSLRWHKYVLERLQTECPDNYVGTSNVALAASLDSRPVGTFAHEMPMVYAGLTEARGGIVRNSHRQFLNAWYEQYGNDLSIALTDTFGSRFFFDDFTAEQANSWRGLRHDSGDPYVFGEQVLQMYEKYGIDPMTKTIVFSDGLDIDTIVSLSKAFEGRVNVLFGWGTTLTNDLGIKPLNVVMKATHVRDLSTGKEADTVKLSDNPGKHTGPAHLVNQYQNDDRYFKAA